LTQRKINNKQGNKIWSSRKTKIVKELKIGDVEGVSQSKIEGYLSMGYKPYLMKKVR